jgi:hypothetical protein
MELVPAMGEKQAAFHLGCNGRAAQDSRRNAGASHHALPFM